MCPRHPWSRELRWFKSSTKQRHPGAQSAHPNSDGGKPLSSDILICVRADLPRSLSGSKPIPCAVCHCQVIVSESGQRKLAQGLSAVCQDCAELILDESDLEPEPISREQVAEVEGYRRRN